jgi:hypothetical protein
MPAARAVGDQVFTRAQALILLGAVVELFTIGTPQPVEAETPEPPREMPPAHAAALLSPVDGRHAEPAPAGAPRRTAKTAGPTERVGTATWRRVAPKPVLVGSDK